MTKPRTILGPFHRVRYTRGAPNPQGDIYTQPISVTLYGVIVDDELVICETLEAAQALSVGALQ